jgi:hypothetical protein
MSRRAVLLAISQQRKDTVSAPAASRVAPSGSNNPRERG